MVLLISNGGYNKNEAISVKKKKYQSICCIQGGGYVCIVQVHKLTFKQASFSTKTLKSSIQCRLIYYVEK